MAGSKHSHPTDAVGDAARNRDQVTKFIGTEAPDLRHIHPTDGTVREASYAESMSSTIEASDGYEKELLDEYPTNEPLVSIQAQLTDAPSSDTPDADRGRNNSGSIKLLAPDDDVFKAKIPETVPEYEQSRQGNNAGMPETDEEFRTRILASSGTENRSGPALHGSSGDAVNRNSQMLTEEDDDEVTDAGSMCSTSEMGDSEARDSDSMANGNDRAASTDVYSNVIMMTDDSNVMVGTEAGLAQLDVSPDDQSDSEGDIIAYDDDSINYWLDRREENRTSR